MSVMSAGGNVAKSAALLTRMSMPPTDSQAAATAVATSASTLTSKRSPRTFAPGTAARKRSTQGAGSTMSAAITVAPAASKASQYATPIPFAPPVTKATRPSRIFIADTPVRSAVRD